MAVVSITAANVVPSADATIVTRTAGETITAGQPVYLDTNNAALKVTANGSGLTFKAFGIAVDGASLGQPVNICVQDPTGMTIGGTVVTGTLYICGANAGAIHPASDNASGWKVSALGVAISSSLLKVFPISQCRADVAT